MGSADRDPAIDRFVASLPVDEDELATAVAAKAVDATIVVEALLRGLEDESPVIRARAARRVELMVEVPPRLEARLRLLADADADRRTREAAAAALRAHRPRVADEPHPDAPRRPLPRLWLARVTTRGVGPARGAEAPAKPRVLLSFVSRDREEAPGVRGRIVEEGDELRLDLSGLPKTLVGHRLQAMAYVTGSSTASVLAIAETPVSETGAVSMPVDPDVYERVARRLATIELVGVEG